jgi:type VI protein secretion system component VasF
MVLGFKGKYLYDNPEGLRRLVEDTKSDIHRAKGTSSLQAISPHGRPGEKLTEVVTRDIPGWVIAVSVLALGFFLFLVFTLVINGSADKVKTVIETIV